MRRFWRRFGALSPVTQHRQTRHTFKLFGMGSKLSTASTHTGADSLAPGTISKEPTPR